MTTISDYHRYLFFGKLTDSLTPEEVRELDELFASNAEARTFYEELLSTLPANEVNSSYAHLKKPGYWKDITGEQKNKIAVMRRIQIFRRMSVAALIAGVLIGSWAIWKYNSDDHLNSSISVTKKPAAVELKLSNGKTINLSTEKGTLNQGSITLQNADNTLSYEGTADGPVGMNSVTVPTGMDYKINLSDGSEVWMNSTTRLDFPSKFVSGKREITISGEAYLQIAKDVSKPFIVHLPGSSVQVTGTQFNVNSYDEKAVKVALVEGGLNMSTDKSMITILPGHQGISTQDSLIQQKFDAKSVLSWRKGLFYFEEATLADLSPVLKRWYGITTVIDRPELRDKQFAGVLDKNKPLEIFLRNMKTISKIESYIDKEGRLHFR